MPAHFVPFTHSARWHHCTDAAPMVWCSYWLWYSHHSPCHALHFWGKVVLFVLVTSHPQPHPFTDGVGFLPFLLFSSADYWNRIADDVKGLLFDICSFCLLTQHQLHWWSEPTTLCICTSYVHLHHLNDTVCFFLSTLIKSPVQLYHCTDDRVSLFSTVISPPSFPLDSCLEIILCAAHQPAQVIEGTEDSGFCLSTPFPPFTQLLYYTSVLGTFFCFCHISRLLIPLNSQLEHPTLPHSQNQSRTLTALKVHGGTTMTLDFLCPSILSHWWGKLLFLTLFTYPVHLYITLMVSDPSLLCLDSHPSYIQSLVSQNSSSMYCSRSQLGYTSALQIMAPVLPCLYSMPSYLSHWQCRTALLITSVWLLHWADMLVLFFLVLFTSLVPLPLQGWSMALSIIHDHILQPVTPCRSLKHIHWLLTATVHSFIYSFSNY